MSREVVWLQNHIVVLLILIIRMIESFSYVCQLEFRIFVVVILIPVSHTENL